MSLHSRFRRQLLALSNRALVDAFDRACTLREAIGYDAPSIMHRLEFLHAEIIQRERTGVLTDEDWRV